MFKLSLSNVKEMFGRNITESIFSEKAFQSYSFGWKKDLLIFFFFFFLFNKLTFDEC